MKTISTMLVLLFVTQLLSGCAQLQGQAPAPPEEPADDVAALAPAPALPREEAFDPDTAAPTQRLVFFAFDSSEVRAESRPVVDAHAGFLLANPNVTALLEGHTDPRGTREYNVALGERRGDSVRRLMIGLGVPPSQLRVVSYGEEMPLAFGDDEASFAENRRVRISY